MRTNMSKLFTFSAMDSEYFNDKQNKIELVSCANEGSNCKELLAVINNNYLESNIYRREKEFQSSIEKLKITFYRTLELQDIQCIKCADFFRSTIIETLKKLKTELKKTSKGFFGTKRYQLGYTTVCEVLQELEEARSIWTIEQKNKDEHFIESYPKKKVI